MKNIKSLQISDRLKLEEELLQLVRDVEQQLNVTFLGTWGLTSGFGIVDLHNTQAELLGYGLLRFYDCTQLQAMIRAAHRPQSDVTVEFIATSLSDLKTTDVLKLMVRERQRLIVALYFRYKTPTELLLSVPDTATGIKYVLV